MRFANFCIWLLLIALAVPNTVSAVVLKAGDGTGNESAPVDDPGFANAGRVGAGTGIYLGNRWVLTANHVGARSITFGGETFEPIPGESIQIGNPQDRGLSANTDMLLFRIAEEPELPELRIGCRQPRSGEQLVLMGHGRDRDTEISAWDVQVGPGPQDDVWTPTASTAVASEVGFRTQSTRTLRWGLAPVRQSNRPIITGNGDVISIETTFPRFGTSPNLSRAATGDSGGPVFHKNGDFWELIGMIHGVTPTKENQPGGSATVLLGTSTFSANLLTYEDELRAVADFGPAPSDFNADGNIDATDIDRIFAAFSEGDHNCNYDLSGNGIVTRADIDLVLNEAGTLPGDANVDGMVSFPDFLILARSFGDEDTGWGGGDFDGDGSTNFGDFISLSSAFGDSFSQVVPAPTTPANIAAVPEPSTAWLMAVGVGLCLANRRVLWGRVPM